MIQIGSYVLKESHRFRCGMSSFELSKGAKVRVAQLDTQNNKVLIDFGGRDCDWYHNSVLDLFDLRGEVTNQAQSNG